MNNELQNLKEQVAKDDRYLESKLNDIYTVYSKFQEKISENYIDENDALTILEEQLDSTNMFKNTEISKILAKFLFIRWIANSAMSFWSTQSGPLSFSEEESSILF